MGTHPIFESDFDCLTAYSNMDAGFGAGFLFGNVDKQGRLESDVFDDQEKRQIKGLSSLGVTGIIDDFNAESKKMMEADDFDMVPQSPKAVDYGDQNPDLEDDFDSLDEQIERKGPIRRKSSGNRMGDIILPSCAPSTGADIILPSLSSEPGEIEGKGNNLDDSLDARNARIKEGKRKKQKEYSETDRQ